MRGLCVLAFLVVNVTLVFSQIHHGHSHGFDGHHIDSGFVRTSGLLTDSPIIIARRRPRLRQLNSVSLLPLSLIRDSGIRYNRVGLLSGGYPIYRRNSLRERRLKDQNKRLMRRIRRLKRLNRKHLNELYDPHDPYIHLNDHIYH